MELLISLSMLSVIAFVSTTSFVSIRKLTEVTRRNEDALRNIRYFLDRLDVEISGAVLVRRAGETLFQSKRMDINGEKVNNLIFTTVSP